MFPGGLELIPVEIVGFEVLRKVWPFWIGVATISNPKLGGLGR